MKVRTGMKVRTPVGSGTVANVYPRLLEAMVRLDKPYEGSVIKQVPISNIDLQHGEETTEVSESPTDRRPLGEPNALRRRASLSPTLNNRRPQAEYIYNIISASPSISPRPPPQTYNTEHQVGGAHPIGSLNSVHMANGTPTQPYEERPGRRDIDSMLPPIDPKSHSQPVNSRPPVSRSQSRSPQPPPEQPKRARSVSPRIPQPAPHHSESSPAASPGPVEDSPQQQEGPYHYDKYEERAIGDNCFCPGEPRSPTPEDRDPRRQIHDLTSSPREDESIPRGTKRPRSISHEEYFRAAQPPAKRQSPSVGESRKRFRPLTRVPPGVSRGDLDKVNKYLEKHDDYEIKTTYHAKVTVKNLGTLRPGNELDDEVINCYMDQLQDHVNKRSSEKILLMNSHFFARLVPNSAPHYEYEGVQRWTEKRRILKRLKPKEVENIFQLDKMVVPVHQRSGESGHWTTGVVSFPEQSIVYYDSMGSHTYSNTFFSKIKRFLEDEYERKCTNRGEEHRPDSIRIQEWSEKIGKCPKQHNGVDCGAFTCSVAKCVAMDRLFSFAQSDMDRIRIETMLSVINGSHSND